jgi:ABC-2 type transport system ATP-binding protein
MALTLARKVPVILMDEPLSGLDPLVRESIVQGLISFMDLEQQTVVITTHEINEIEPLLDMVILLKRGRLIGMEEAETLRSEQNMGIVEWMKQTYAHHV